MVVSGQGEKDTLPVDRFCNTQDDRSTKLKAVQDLILKYVNQMLYGCGSPECKQVLCDNGRQNAIGRPIRRYTPRSARAIALTLAHGPRPRSRLCPGLSENGTRARFKVEEGPRDPASIIQQLADLEQIKQLCEPEQAVTLRSNGSQPGSLGVGTQNEEDELFDSYHSDLDYAESLISSHEVDGEQKDWFKEVVTLLWVTLNEFRRAVPLPLDQSMKEGYTFGLMHADTVTQCGAAYPESTTDSYMKHAMGTSNKSGFKISMECFDELENARMLRLLDRWLSTLARLHNVTSSEAVSRPPGSNANDEITSLLMQSASPNGRVKFVIWLKKAFLRHWNGETMLELGTIPRTSLDLLSAIFAARDHCYDTPLESAYNISAIAAHIDATDMAHSWLEFCSRGPVRARHLLEFHCLFSGSDLATYFRIVNHFRMQRAHSDAEKAALLRSRATPRNFVFQPDARLLHLEDHYLLLNVGRNSILSDSLNQVWQRRSTELLRPLRVRLGEVDLFELGHDLGGIQIEFFNLFCKEIFSEQLGMFTSDARTGLSYFRPACLQPLYMFELCGLLFALAVYNGITLPVNFPLAFYMGILGVPCNDLESIRDAWPAMHKSLNDILENDIPGLDHVFALEANGVRLSISSFEVEPERDPLKMTARVVEATPIVHHELADERHHKAVQHQPSNGPPQVSSIDCTTLSWPGWSFKVAPSSEPEEITAETKHNYLATYIHWLTSASIAAQLHHFLTGFHRVLPQSHLRMLSPRHLQSLTEGHRTLSIPALRSAATYEGYNPQSTYISTFWSIVAAWPEQKQKDLLKFVTAAERVPVGGEAHVTFKITRLDHPGAEKGLPTSSTCFGNLMLPRYESGRVLEEKLTVALEMGLEGFGTG